MSEGEEKLDKLVEVVNKLTITVGGFDNIFNTIDKKLDGVDKRFNTIDKKLDGVDKRFNTIDKKLDGYIEFSSERFTKIEDRLGSVENNMATKKDLQNLKLDLLDKYASKEKVNDHEMRIKKLEEKLA